MGLSAVGKMIKAVYLAVAPSLSNGDYHELTLTNAGRLRVDASGSTIVVTTGESTLTVLGYQQITGVTSASAQALTVPAGANFAWIQIENGDSRWRADGTAPTSAVGFPLLQDTGFFFNINNAGLTALKFIAQTVNITINATYYSSP